MKKIQCAFSILFSSALLFSCKTETRKESTEHSALTGDTQIADSGSVDDSGGEASKCPAGMVSVSGKWCPTVDQRCLKWLDESSASANSGIGPLRCAEFAPGKCLSKESEKIAMDFCIDKFEYPGIAGQKPKMWMTYYDAETACKNEGKRLCTDKEWTFACEGERAQPYSYGDGIHRDATACNIDLSWKDPTKTPRDILDQSVNVDSKPQCTSPFGAQQMLGNSDEWVVNTSGKPFISGLKGGHWAGVRNRCRPMTDVHGPTFSYYETGVRCCK